MNIELIITEDKENGKNETVEQIRGRALAIHENMVFAVECSKLAVEHSNRALKIIAKRHEICTKALTGGTVEPF